MKMGNYGSGQVLWGCLFALLCGRAGATPVNGVLLRVESAHFVYIYQDTLEPQLPMLTRHCEDAHALLAPRLGWTPKEKTVVLFFDSEDIHNGWATVYPKPRMMIYAADAPPGSTIYEPGRYLRRTVFHEYAHILAMDAQYGFDAMLSAVFGRAGPLGGDPVSTLLLLLSVPPGAVAPDWYLEGVSIWAETELVGPGRGRSTLVDMMMRTAVAEGRLQPPNRWALDNPEWPYGNSAYLYGLKLVEYIHDDFSESGRSAVGDVVDSVSHSFWFNFNRRSRAATGRSFNRLAVEAMAAETVRQSARIETLGAVPFTDIGRLTPDGLSVVSPKFDRTGDSVYFSGGPEEERSCICRYDIPTKRLHRIRGARTSYPVYTELTMDPARENLYYARIDVQGRECARSEIYRLPVDGRQARLVAGKGRYRTPAVYGDSFAAVTHRAGIASLVTAPIGSAGRKEAERVLTTAAPGEALIHPVYTPDGGSVLYVWSDETGSELRLVAPADGKSRVLVKWPGLILSPAVHPGGDRVVFVADRNGVYNLYETGLADSSEPRALTHVSGGVFGPDFSPDGKRIAVSVYDARGYHLAILDHAGLGVKGGELPVISEDWKRVVPADVVERAGSEAAPSVSSSRRYSSLGGIGFDGWSPWLLASGDGIGVGVAGMLSDPTDFQQLYVSAGGESGYGLPLGSVIYSFSGLYPTLTLFGDYGPETYTELLSGENGVYYDYCEVVGVGGAALSIPWVRADRQIECSLGVSFADRSEIAESAGDYAGDTIVQTNIFEGSEVSAWCRFDFMNAVSHRRSHSLEDGRHVSLTAAWSDKSLAGDLTRMRFRADWAEYVRLPWGRNHVLRLGGTYATGAGDATLQGQFGLGADLLSMMDVPGLDRNIALRGYGPNYQVGDDVIEGCVAYRFPLLRVYRNINTTAPFYGRQWFGELFYEGGVADGDDDAGDKNAWLNSAGLELNFATTVLRMLSLAPGLGVVYAFDFEERDRFDAVEGDDPLSWGDGKLQVYLSLKAVVSF